MKNITQYATRNTWFNTNTATYRWGYGTTDTS